MTSDINHTSWFFHGAIDEIDGVFGEGFAKQHPELVAGYMQAAATVHAGRWISERLGEIGTHGGSGAIEYLATHLGERMVEAAETLAGELSRQKEPV